MSINELKQKIVAILRPYHVKRAALFGSSARGQMGPASDIDLLVDIQEDISLIKFVGLKLELEEALGKKVDLVEYSTIKPALRKKILSEQIQLI